MSHSTIIQNKCSQQQEQDVNSSVQDHICSMEGQGFRQKILTPVMDGQLNHSSSLIELARGHALPKSIDQSQGAQISSSSQDNSKSVDDIHLRLSDASSKGHLDPDVRQAGVGRDRSASLPAAMDVGILRALKTVKNNPYVQYVGLGLAGLVTQKDQHDPATGAPLRKSKLQLVRISAAVCGIELCYAAETAFVSPILLKLGVPPSLMTMIWCLSPFLGFFLVPIMGSLSDRCQFKLGRRRPFIILMSIGIILGLALVPNGETLGLLLGDSGNETVNWYKSRDVLPLQNSSHSATPLGISFSIPADHLRGIVFTVLGVAMLDFNCDACQSPCRAYLLDVTVPEDHSTGLTMFTVMAGAGGSVGYIMGGIDWNATRFGEALGGHIRVVFSIVLIAFLVCVTLTLTSFKEAPLGLLQVTNQDMQANKKKVSQSSYRKFINEDSPETERPNIGQEQGSIDIGQKPISYGAVSEINTNVTQAKQKPEENDLKSSGVTLPNNSSSVDTPKEAGKLKSERSIIKAHLTNGSVYRSTQNENWLDPTTKEVSIVKSDIIGEADDWHNNVAALPSKQSGNDQSREVINPYAKTVHNEVMQVEELLVPVEVSTDVTLKTYLSSIVKMPRSMWTLCLCNLLCWMSLVCYSLYFTDFVGQSVYGGDPQAPVGSDLHNRYDDGVRLGSFGMSLYSLACACYSMVIEKLVQRFRAKKVYVLGQLVFTVGMAIMAMSRSKIAVLLLSPTAGIMYATLFTMPYLLVAHYHTRGLFSHGDGDGNSSSTRKQIRGLGTDVAIISSMVFLAQFLLSVILGTVVTALNSTTTVIIISCILSCISSGIATQITYLDL